MNLNMAHSDRLIYLISAMIDEMPQYCNIAIPDDEPEQKKLLRSLMNVRPPFPVSKDFLAVQDLYLSEEAKRRGVIDCKSLSPVSADKRIYLWKGDITKLKADAIVNAANSGLVGCFIPLHNCIDNIIHSFAGVQLRLACSKIMEEQGYEEPVGRAKLTLGFNLPCRYILHTVGPSISGNLKKGDCELLADCYKSCLELAVKSGIKSIAFCCISTGVFNFPQEKAAEIAVDTVRCFLNNNSNISQVIFDVYKDEDYILYNSLLS